MKFYISVETKNTKSKNVFCIGELFIYTEKETTIEDFSNYIKIYDLYIDGESITYQSNELNSNFIYYDLNGNITNTLYYFSAEKHEIDSTGVIQRLTGPDYCNFGSRTIYKDVKKSLPSKKYIFRGVKVEITDSGKRLLYNKNELDSSSVKKIENKILEFHRSLFKRYDTIYMAMSGGLDSRLSFCALQHIINEEVDQTDFSSSLHLISYGGAESEDVKISGKIAQKYDYDFILFPNYSKVWPTEEEYSKYCISGNGIGISNWNMIRSDRRFSNNECIVLGDLYEIIVGRKLEISFSRSARLKLNNTKKKRKEFEKSPQLFIIKKILGDLTNVCEMKKTYISKYSVKFNWDEVISDTKSDLNEWIDIIPKELLPSQILEYFTLIAYTNPEYRNQIYTVRGFANAHSISEDIGLINLIVSIHPDKRKNNRLLQCLFRDSKIWSSLLAFPQASAPYLPARYNSAILVNIQKLIRHQTEKIIYRLEPIFPACVKSRWSDWRSGYRAAKERDMFNKVGSNVESYIASKGEIGKSLPIPNFAFVNFESILYLIKRQ
jgi:hypothetical protein